MDSPLYPYRGPIRKYQGEPRYIYAGPSWAVASFPESLDSTNLAWEWGYNNINISAHGTSVLWQLDKITKTLEKKKLPIIWVYNEPLLDIKTITQMDLDIFVTQPDWRNIISQCNQYCLERINDLGIPVLLVGAHCDIIDCSYDNITVACHSWQKWLAQQSGMPVNDNVIKVTTIDNKQYDLDHCWGAELVQKFLYDNLSIRPDPNLLDSVWNILNFWDELQRRDWFFEVHPNKRGNIEFANFLKPTVDKFLEENSNG